MSLSCHGLQIRPACPCDVQGLLPLIREADVKEFELLQKGLAHQRSLEEVIICGILGGASWLAFDEIGLVGVFGFMPYGTNLYAPWLLCTERIKLHGKAALRLGKAMLAELLRERSILLVNVVSKQNIVALRFVKALGFSLQDCAGVYIISKRG